MPVHGGLIRGGLLEGGVNRGFTVFVYGYGLEHGVGILVCHRLYKVKLGVISSSFTVYHTAKGELPGSRELHIQFRH